MNTKLTSPTEVTLSQLPAMRVLHNLGWQYLSKAQVREQRDGNSSFILQDIFKEVAAKINDSSFSDRDIATAMSELRGGSGDLLSSNIDIYKSLISGANIDKSDDADIKGFKPFKYIDWDNISNNLFHFTCEFDASQGRQHKRLDIVLFVNGIPMAVIECKAPTQAISKATAQLEDYQRCLPKLFSFVQLVVAVNTEKSQYAAMGGNSNYWAGWREASEDNQGFSKEHISSILATEVPADILQVMDGDLNQATGVGRGANKTGGVDNSQNQLLISLFNRERFLDLLRNFTIVGENSKKVALAHQYFVVKNGLIRIAEKDEQDDANTRRKGGVIWHTQGSGKSNVMIFFIKNLQRHLGAEAPRVILVSDRLELNDQMVNNLKESNVDYKLAKSGKDLRDLIINKSAPVILANVHKFSNAAVDIETKESFVNESENIFLLVDECHRSEYGDHAKAMRRILPNGCYIGFTGTPLLDRYKNDTFATFGHFIAPTYPIKSALADDTVVPLLYEARNIKLATNAEQIDKDTTEATKGLSAEDTSNLKRRYSQVKTLSNLQALIEDVAEDIAVHYLRYIASFPARAAEIKAQLVVPSKAQAVLYHEALAQYDIISKVIISPPGQFDEKAEPDNITKIEDNKIVEEFWEEEVIKGGQTPRDYERQVIKDFKQPGGPQILVVVDKLITGFDAPNNTILYLCKSLRDHTLLQAIARVNRLYQDKPNGLIVDYNMSFGNMQQALNDYEILAGYTLDDIDKTLQSIDVLLEEFDRVYAKIKAKLNLSGDNNTDEMWGTITLSMLKQDVANEFCSHYKRFMELYAQLASVQSFHDRYSPQFDEIDEHIEWATKLYEYIITLNAPHSKDLLVAQELIKYSLNTNVTSAGFNATGERLDIGNMLSHIREDGVVRDPAEEYKLDDETKRRGGFGSHKNHFQEYIKKLKDMERQVEDMKDSHPTFAGKMSELIQEALEEFDQMIDDYNKKLKTYTYVESTSEELLNTTYKNLQVCMEQKRVDEQLPSCLEELPDALEYYHVVGNMLKKEKINIAMLEQALCDVAKNTYDILEGLDRQGWWDDINDEKKVRLAVKQEMWKLEDSSRKFSDGRVTQVSEEILDIGRARQSSPTF